MKLLELQSLPSVWYHATTEENWLKIQQSGVLLSKRKFYFTHDLTGDYKWVNQTWLANSPGAASNHGPVLLQVHYIPKNEDLFGERLTDNLQKRMRAGKYVTISITKPIPLSDIKRIR